VRSSIIARIITGVPLIGILLLVAAPCTAHMMAARARKAKRPRAHEISGRTGLASVGGWR